MPGGTLETWTVTLHLDEIPEGQHEDSMKNDGLGEGGSRRGVTIVIVPRRIRGSKLSAREIEIGMVPDVESPGR